ncbi:unnamed protein product, partial [marine sediment metagenome]
MERKMRLKVSFAVVVLVVLTSFLTVGPVFAGEKELTLSPINPQFQEYMDLVRVGKAPEVITAEGYYLGLIPAPLDMSHTRGLSVIPVAKKVSYPASYDLRILGRLTSIKDQGSCD